MLWDVRMPLKRKLALMGIFSLTILIIIISIVRVTVVYVPGETADVSWLYLWSNIELHVGKKCHEPRSRVLQIANNHSSNSFLPRIFPPAFR